MYFPADTEAHRWLAGIERVRGEMRAQPLPDSTGGAAREGAGRLRVGVQLHVCRGPRKYLQIRDVEWRRWTDVKGTQL
jgi:hypothetical protein